MNEKRAVKYYECKCGGEWCMKELQSFKFLNDNNHWAYKCPNCGKTYFYIYDSNERFVDNIVEELRQGNELIENVQLTVGNITNKLISEFLKVLDYLHTEIIRQIQVVHIEKGRVWGAEDYYDLNEAFDNEKEKWEGKIQ